MSDKYLIRSTEMQKQCAALSKAQKQQRKFICERLLGISAIHYIHAKKKLLKRRACQQLHPNVPQTGLPENKMQAQLYEILRANNALTKVNRTRQVPHCQKRRTAQKPCDEKRS